MAKSIRPAKRISTAISNRIKANFVNKYLTHNLVDTMKTTKIGINAYQIYIPATKYDFAKWNKEKVIMYRPELGSYAQLINITGGFSKTHKDYIDKAITKSVEKIARSYEKSGYQVDIKYI